MMSEKRFVACDKWADSEGNIFRFVVIDTKVFGDKQFILRCNHWSQAQDICNRLNDTLDELREENEQLQKQVKSFETTMNATSDYNAFLESKITTLEKENEQLRKENKDLNDIEWEKFKKKYHLE